MTRAVELTGRPASPGLAQGPLLLLGAPLRLTRHAGTPPQEQEALSAALAQSIADLGDLASAADDEAAAMLAFQIAMLEDGELSAPAYQAIVAGMPADRAWLAAIEAQIADHAASGDEYFSARTADLKDMRDRVLSHLGAFEMGVTAAGMVLAGEDMTPTRFLCVDWSHGGGIMLRAGSASSHVAILARARGVPMVVGVGDAPLHEHDEVLLDGTSGRVILSPDVAHRQAFAICTAKRHRDAQRLASIARQPATTADGTPIKVLVNVARLEDLPLIDLETCDGIGLMRTEFLFGHGPDLPDEDTQLAAYRRLLDWARGRPVTIRTLDAGGDKPIAGLTVDGEANPFLGRRGIRLSFLREDVFRVQLRALARAACFGSLNVMWPMVAVPQEFEKASRLFHDELALLKAAGIAAARPRLGLMVEVPSAAIAPDLFAKAEFFSIGSNDLIQYVAAAARDNGALAQTAEDALPVIMRLVRHLTGFGAQHGIDVSICGDLASDTAHLPELIEAGLRSVSVAPAAIGAVKDAISRIDLGAMNGQA